MKDLLMLESVDEDLVVEEIIKRYKSGQVYTFLGPVLIAVNPYKILKKQGHSIYDVRWMEDFSGKERHQCDPHPFAIAEDTYINLMRFGKNQSLLITGESGSGKTETSKHVMQYITTMSTKFRSKHAAQLKRRLSIEQIQEIDTNIARVTEILWSSNHILEAFGNAQTIRNTNSSRFGKYMILQFNLQGQVIGGQIQNYLLEKSRVIQQAKDERNFHVFYQMFYGSNAIEKSKWKLENTRIEDFYFLSNKHNDEEEEEEEEEEQKKDTSKTKIDIENFILLKEKMKAIGFKEEKEMDQIFSTLAAILWLGNIQFQDQEEQHELHHVTRAMIKEEKSQFALQQAATLLKLTSNELEQMLTQRTLQIANTKKKQQTFLNARQATKMTHSFARSLYGKTFDWLFHSLNQGISANHTSKVSLPTIGILDIYGFEIFQVNGFEQLCINYVNEKLQQLFIQQTLKQEQEEYHKEQIPWQDVSFFNNQQVCDLIEYSSQATTGIKLNSSTRSSINSSSSTTNTRTTNGLFSLLDEQIAISRFELKDLIQRFETFHLGKNPFFLQKSKIQSTCFCIQHYAGQVEYDVTNFFEANHTMDDIHLNSFWLKTLNTIGTTTSNSTSSTSTITTNKQHRHGHRHGRPMSTCQQFRQQMKELLIQLNACQPHYIRCIKPNENKQPLGVNSFLIQEQVQYLGLMENLHVRRQGYAYKETYTSFLQRYKLLSKETWPHLKAPSSRQGVVAILTAHDVGINESSTHTRRIRFEQDGTGLGAFALGKTKIFLRHPQALSSLEIEREKKLPLIVQILEKAYQKYRLRLRVFFFQQIYTLVKERYTFALENCMKRRQRHPSVMQLKENLLIEWNKCMQKYLPVKNTWHQNILLQEKINHICFVQSYIRAKNARVSFLNLKKAQIICSKHYRGTKIRRQMSNEFYDLCQQKIVGLRTEFEKFMGQKKRRRNSFERRIYLKDYIGFKHFPSLGIIFNRHHDGYIGNYKNHHDHNGNKSNAPNGKLSNGSPTRSKLLFLAWVIKINERFAHQPRILMVGEEKILNIKSDSKISKPLERRSIKIKDLTAIYLSTLPDDYVILQVNNASEKIDLFLKIEEKIELVQILRNQFRILMQGKKELPVLFGNSIQFFALKGRKNHVTFGLDPTKKRTEYRKINRRSMHVTVGAV
jgi:myosin-1